MPLRGFCATQEYSSVWLQLQQAHLQKDHLHQWLYCKEGFDYFRGWLAKRQANENVDFIKEVMKFKQLDDVNETKDTSLSIFKKFISDGARAQVCIPDNILAQVSTTAQPSSVLSHSRSNVRAD